MVPVTAGTKIFQQGRLTFILAPKKITIRTALGQEFFLLPRMHYFNRRLNLIRVMIALNEVRDLNELASWCRPGIEWVPTSPSYESSLEEEDLLV